MRFLIEEKTIKIVFIFTCLIFVFNCEVKRDSIGGSDDLVVLAAKEDREQIKSLLSIVFNDTLLTPEPEPFYKVKFSDPANYQALKTQTNLIIASIGDFDLNPATKLVKDLLGVKKFNQTLEGDPVILSKDQFAKNQLFMIVSGSDSDSIKEYFLENNEWIKSQYNTNFDKKQSQYLLETQHQEDKESMLLESYGWNINLPWGWEIIRNETDSNFVWIGQEMPFRWLAVYWRDGNHFSKETATELANNFPKEYFKSIQYNNDFLSIDWIDHYREDAAYKISGLWESIEGAKGGPFQGHLFYDNESDRTFYITYLVYNPGGRKAFYIRQMDLIAQTFRVK